MPSPKSGTSCTLVAPASPADAKEADNADPGEVSAIKAEQRQTQTGKYGSVPVTPYKPASATSGASAAGAGASTGAGAPAPSQAENDQPKQWIEIQLVGVDNKPIAGENYRITLPDGSVDEGTTDGNGLARVDGIDPGSCQITFPNRDQDAWQPL